MKIQGQLKKMCFQHYFIPNLKPGKLTKAGRKTNKQNQNNKKPHPKPMFREIKFWLDSYQVFREQKIFFKVLLFLMVEKNANMMSIKAYNTVGIELYNSH